MTQLLQPLSPACNLSDEAPSCSQQNSPATFMTQAVRRQSHGNKRKSSLPAPGSNPGEDDDLASPHKRSRKSMPASVTTEQQGVQQEQEQLEEHDHQSTEVCKELTVVPAQPTVLSCSKAVLGTVFSPLFRVFGHGHGQHHATTAGAAATATTAVVSNGEEAEEEQHEEEEEDGKENDGSMDQAAAHAQHSHHAHHPPPPEVPEAAESDYEEDEEEEDYVDFDPLLFIKSLPPLEECTPKFRQALLPRQTRQCKRKTLVLDLDETLVHSSLEGGAPADFSFPVTFNNQEHTIHVRTRPHLAAFMARVAELFEIVVFTASQRVYAEKLLNIIDPGPVRHIKHRIYRESCVVVDGNYLKDLSVLGRDLANTLIVDNSPQAFGFQVDNGVPIESWYEDPDDEELPKLLPFLESLVDVEDVRPHIARKFRLRELIAKA